MGLSMRKTEELLKSVEAEGGCVLQRGRRTIDQLVRIASAAN
jgi:hypothetical protein